MKTSLEVRPALPPLPVEIILKIVENIASPSRGDDPEWNEAAVRYDLQKTLHACSLVNRAWYDAAVQELYRYPRLTSRNYDHFVRTICPSVNLHVRKSELASLVRVLDLRQLVFAGSKSLVARLLGRVKENLEMLRAPQTSFAINSLAALSKCRRLSALDMSFVTESIPSDDFFLTIEKIATLETLSLPRSSLSRPRHDIREIEMRWPPKLATLSMTFTAARMIMHAGPSSRPRLERLDLTLPEFQRDYFTVFLKQRIGSMKHLCLYGMGAYSSSFTESVLRASSVRRIEALSYHCMNERNPFDNFMSILDHAWSCPTAFISGEFGDGKDEGEIDELVRAMNLDTDRWLNLQDLIMGPQDRRRSDPDDETFDARSMHVCLERFNKTWSPNSHSVRRIFIYFRQVQNVSVDLLNDLSDLSSMLMNVEKERVLDRRRAGDQAYRARESGVFVFQCREDQDPDVQIHYASPMSDLAQHFSAEELDSWPHARNWHGGCIRRRFDAQIEK